MRARYNQEDQRFEIYSLWLHGVLAPLGDSYTKYIPAYVQDLAPRQLRILLDAYLAGDGHLGASWEYGSSSQRLAFDVSVVCLKLGWCVRMVETDRSDNWQKRPHWRCRINRKMLRPWWKKGRARSLPVGAGGDGPLRRDGPRRGGAQRAGLLPAGGQVVLAVRRRPIGQDLRSPRGDDGPRPPLADANSPGRRPSPRTACPSSRSPAAARSTGHTRDQRLYPDRRGDADLLRRLHPGRRPLTLPRRFLQVHPHPRPLPRTASVPESRPP